MSIKLNIPKVKSFIEKIHPTNSVQIETLDDEIDEFTLYRLIEPPLDFTLFKNKFEKFGIDLIIQAKNTHFNYKVE